MKHEILTDKLKLKLVELSDAEKIHRLRTNAEVSKYITRDLNKSVADIEAFIVERSKKDLFFSINTLEKNELVGTIAIWKIDYEKKYAEVGYELFPEFQNKGIMTNAINGILDYAFNKLNFEIIEAFTDKRNQNSRKLLKKVGFYLLENKIDDNKLNNVIYQIKK